MSLSLKKGGERERTEKRLPFLFPPLFLLSLLHSECNIKKKNELFYGLTSRLACGKGSRRRRRETRSRGRRRPRRILSFFLILDLFLVFLHSLSSLRQKHIEKHSRLSLRYSLNTAKNRRMKKEKKETLRFHLYNTAAFGFSACSFEGLEKRKQFYFPFFPSSPLPKSKQRWLFDNFTKRAPSKHHSHDPRQRSSASRRQRRGVGGAREARVAPLDVLADDDGGDDCERRRRRKRKERQRLFSGGSSSCSSCVRGQPLDSLAGRGSIQ